MLVCALSSILSPPYRIAGVKLLIKNKTGEAESLDNSQNKQTQADYESIKMLNQYLSLHFGESDVIPHTNRPDFALDFPRRCAKLLQTSYEKYSSNRDPKISTVLDMGCAVGGSTFHLASLGFQKVLGIDYSKTFVDGAKNMRDKGKLTLSEEPTDDSIQTHVVVGLTKEENAARMKTEFQVGDACNLPENLGSFDAILGANLLCRLPDPYAFLKRLPNLVKPGGIVLFISPFSWLSSFTPRSNWIGPVGNSEKELISEMKSLGFELQEESNMPLLIKEHRRKYQYIVSHAAVFKNHN